MDTRAGFIFWRAPKAVLRVTGEDAFTFLQGQFTNELRQPPGSSTYGLWLNQKGRVIADSNVLRWAEREFLVLSANAGVGELRQRLEDYIVADDVVLRDETEGAGGLMVGGADCATAVQAVFGAVPAPGNFVRSGEAIIYRGRRLASESYEVFGPASSLTQSREQLEQRGFTAIGEGEMERRRIEDRVPAVPQDLGPTDLPNEGGLDDSAISFTKGCYLGQEVMARLKNLGQVRRRLEVVHGQGTPPAAGSALYQHQKKLGELRSVAAGADDGFVAFAMLSLVNRDAEAGFSLAPDGVPVVWIGSHE